MNWKTFETGYLIFTIVGMMCFITGLLYAPIVGLWVLSIYSIASVIAFAVVYLKRKKSD